MRKAINDIATVLVILILFIAVVAAVSVWANDTTTITQSNSGNNEVASSSNQCPNGDFATNVNESSSGVITVECKASSGVTYLYMTCPTGEQVYGNTSSGFQCYKSENFYFESNTNYCSIGGEEYAGFNLTYTTLTSPYLHNIIVTINFQVESTSQVKVFDTSEYGLSYYTGKPPGCDTSVLGLTSNECGNYYIVSQESAYSVSSSTEMEQSITCVLTNLSPSTTYWFDIKITQQTSTWTYSNPQMTIIEQ